MNDFKPQPVNRLRQQIEQQILEAIVSGQLADGDRLPSETELAERFGVARSTIREALNSLSSKGLIDKVTGVSGGSFIRLLDASRFAARLTELMRLVMLAGTADHHQLAAVREMVEVPACRLAAQHRTDAEAQRLLKITSAEKGLSPDDPSLADLDTEFHSIIAGASGNTILAAFVFALHAVAQPANRVPLDGGGRQVTAAHHVAIARAIERGDPEAAERAIRKHLAFLSQVTPSDSRRQRVREVV
jgi:GntR family transcriptional regulator, transcriptional repressor for pyruvate dehydrogenase complex